MEIYWKGPVHGQSGWERLTRGMVLSLDRLGVKIQLDPKYEWNMESCGLEREDLTRLNRLVNTRIRKPDAVILHQYVSKEDVNAIGWLKDSSIFKACYSLFETDKCPTPWVSGFNRMDETWVYSEFNRRSYSSSSVNNAHVMPVGIDLNLYNPDVKPLKFDGQKGYTFITNGDFTERKNFEGLIEAFVTEFTQDEDVCLLIKAHYGGFTREHKMYVLGKIKEVIKMFNKNNPPRILFTGDKVPEGSVPRFYASGDCFVLISRGEGLGLPYLEALACGKPCIATNWGGQTEYLNDSNSYLIGSGLKVIDDMEYIRKCLWALNHRWAYPSVPELRERMRFAFTYKDASKEKGMKGRADMEKLSWDKASLWMLDRIFKFKESKGVSI